MSWFNIIECFQSYGENCHNPCSQHCYNRNFDRYNGSCLTGCTGGFYGKRCELGKYLNNRRLENIYNLIYIVIGWLKLRKWFEHYLTFYLSLPYAGIFRLINDQLAKRNYFKTFFDVVCVKNFTNYAVMS